MSGWGVGSRLCRVALLAVAASLVGPASAWALEWRPAVGLGYSRVVESHLSASPALRVQVLGPLFLQAEYLVLRASGHTDHGPAFLVGLSSRSRASLRVFAGVGGGPVKGFGGDDGIGFVAAGASYPLGRSGAFVQGEVRFGLLGESGYSQVGVAVGLSR